MLKIYQQPTISVETILSASIICGSKVELIDGGDTGIIGGGGGNGGTIGGTPRSRSFDNIWGDDDE